MVCLIPVLYTHYPFTSDIHPSFVEHFQQRFIAWENAFSLGFAMLTKEPSIISVVVLFASSFLCPASCHTPPPA